MTRVMTSISPEHRDLARRLTEGMFKRDGKPPGEKSGPQYAIHKSLELMALCESGKIFLVQSEDYEALQNGDAVLIPSSDYEAVQHAVLKRQATTEAMQVMATAAAVSALLVTEFADEDEAQQRAKKLDPNKVDAFSNAILADALNQVANAVLETEHNATEAEQPPLLKLARTLFNDAKIVRMLFQRQSSTTH